MDIGAYINRSKDAQEKEEQRQKTIRDFIHIVLAHEEGPFDVDDATYAQIINTLTLDTIIMTGIWLFLYCCVALLIKINTVGIPDAFLMGMGVFVAYLVYRSMFSSKVAKLRIKHD